MSVEAVLILALLAFLVGWFWSKPPLARTDPSADAELRSRLDSIDQALEQIQSRLDDLPVKPGVEDRRRFELAHVITLEDVRRWAQGDTMLLMSQSYSHPAHTPEFAAFGYRHDRLDTIEQSDFGFEVHGYRYSPTNGEWVPYTFFANEKECSTSDCRGGIRALSSFSYNPDQFFGRKESGAENG